MEMEYINENTMRVFIASEDLVDRGISFTDIIGDQKAVESFFLSVLEEVDVSRRFQDSEAITFQVMPKKGGIDLYISKTSAEPSSPEDHQAYKQLLNVIDEMDEEVRKEENILSKDWNQEDWNQVILGFQNFDDLIAFSHAYPLRDVQVDLYQLKGQFYYLLTFNPTEYDPGTVENAIYCALEYGQLPSINQAVLKEHGQALIQGRANQSIAKNFK